MPRDDDDLDDEERELIRQHRQSRRDEDDSDEVSITFPDGRGFTGSWRRAVQVAAAGGFKLAPDPEPEGEEKPRKAGGGGNVKRFSGRRIS